MEDNKKQELPIKRPADIFAMIRRDVLVNTFYLNPKGLSYEGLKKQKQK